MNFPFYIARRYLFSKKSTHAINIISGISMVGVAVATMALVVTLSVFNGFHDLVAGLFTNFDPQLKVMPAEGKTVPADDPLLAQIRSLEEVEMSMQTVEDMALAIYGERQTMVKIKGVEENFDELTNIRDILEGEGVFQLKAADIHFGIPGILLAARLGMGYYYDSPLTIYAPRRQGQLNMGNPSDGFVQRELYSPGVLFNVEQAKYDNDYILTDISFARDIFDCEGEISALELKLKPGNDLDDVKAEIKRIVGDRFMVSDRYEQQADTFNIMKIEKLIAYIFLTFILMVACFNIIGSLSMLIIDKKDDVRTLRSLGATDRMITRIFLFEGRMISAIGAFIGIIIGLLLCWAQQTFGIVGLGKSSGQFIIEAYPVSVHAWDILVIFITVMAVSCFAVWYPIRHFAKRLL